MSRGSFCRSPSMVIMTRPRALSKPAAKAAVWPKLRRNRITRSRVSVACSRARRSKLSSVLPSSTTMISYGRPQADSVCVSSRWSSLSAGASFRTGMTTLSSGDIVVIIRDLSVLPVLRFAPQDVGDRADQENGDRQNGGQRGVAIDECHRAIAVPEGQERFDEVPGAPADGNPHGEFRDAAFGQSREE